MTRPTILTLPLLTPDATPPAMSDTSRLDELEMRVVHQDQQRDAPHRCKVG